MRITLARAVLGAALLAIASPLHAQGYVGGLVHDAGDGSPLPCVLVALEDTLGHVVASGLTSSEGAFQFDAPDSGTYRLRFSIWNHESVLVPPQEMTPRTESAREYRVGFGPPLPALRLPADTAADSPPGRVLHPEKSRMRYPDDLRDRGVQGDVQVNLVVDSSGFVVPTSVRITQSSHLEFTRAVLAFLRTAQFAPARHDHAPVCALLLDQPITFRLGP